MKRFLGSLLWGLVALIPLLAGNGTHGLWDRDEPRNAVASRTMLETGNWVVPQFNGELRAHKPPLVNWMQAASMAVLGKSAGAGGEFAARLPNAVAGAGTVAAVHALMVVAGASTGACHVAALLTLINPLLLLVNKAATLDGVLTFTIALALFLHMLHLQGRFRWWLHSAFWLVVGLSILQKGPPGPIVLLGAALTNRIARRQTTADAPAAWLRWLVGLAIVAAIGLPWVFAVQQATAGEFMRIAIGKHVVERATSGMEGHSGPVWYYVPVLLVVFSPVAGLVWGSIRQGWRQRTESLWPLVAGWFVVPFVVFSLIKTKLPHYMAPLMPAVSLACGLAWDSRAHWIHKMRRLVGVVHGMPLVGAGGALLFSGTWAAQSQDFSDLATPLWVCGAGILVGGLVGGACWWKGKPAAALAGLAATAAWFIASGVVVLVERVDHHRAARVITEALRPVVPPQTELGAVGYQEPSLVWWWGRNVRMLARRRPTECVQFLAEAGPRAVIITADRLAKWKQEYPAETANFKPIMFRHALDLQSGLDTTLTVLLNFDQSQAISQ